MAKINLREFYTFYQQDVFVEVTGELDMLLRQWRRDENAPMRKRYRHRAHFSLDRSDGIEHKVLFVAASPEEQYFRTLTCEELHSAISALPDKQGKRIYAHFFLDMSQTEIARAEGVSCSVVLNSIRRGLKKLSEILEKGR